MGAPRGLEQLVPWWRYTGPARHGTARHGTARHGTIRYWHWFGATIICFFRYSTGRGPKRTLQVPVMLHFLQCERRASSSVAPWRKQLAEET